MSRRTSYEPGTPCWIDLNSPDVDASTDFYTSLFGWDHEDQHDEDGTRIYTNFSKDGALVAGLGGQQPGMEGMPAMWTSYIAVEDVDASVKAAEGAGGKTVMPAMDVMDQGRMAMVKDPASAVIAMWQAGEHKGAEVVNEPDTWSWNELLSRDIDAAKPFYSDVFGWTYQTMDMPSGPYYVIEGGDEGGLGGLMAMPQQLPEDVPSFWGVYFTVADADATIATAEQSGGSKMWGPDDSPIGRMAGLTDAHGGMFTVLQPAPSQES